MSLAIQYIYYAFDKVLNFMFNQMEIDTNITIGWIYISLIVFGVLMGSILNIPHRIGNFSNYTGQTIKSETKTTNEWGEEHRISSVTKKSRKVGK